MISVKHYVYDFLYNRGKLKSLIPKEWEKHERTVLDQARWFGNTEEETDIRGDLIYTAYKWKPENMMMRRNELFLTWSKALTWNMWT